jgi:glycosyltransferase involved in cell wall biosynthesis
MNRIEKKNIIFITNLHLWSLDANKGGKAFYLTVKGYLKSNWNLIIVSTGGGIPNDIYEKASVIEKKNNSIEKIEFKGIFIISTIARFLKYFLNNRFYYKQSKEVIKKIGTKNTLLYAYEIEGVKSAKKLSNEFKIPLINRFQGTILANIKDSYINRLRRTPHFSALKTQADLVIMTNDGTQGNKVLNKLGNNSKKIVFWRNGVDGLDEYIINKKIYSVGNKFYFLTVSRLVYWKRVHLAIEGLAKIVNNYPYAYLIIVGDGPEMDALVELAKTLKIESNVIFKGAINQMEVKNIMSNCDVFLSFYDLSNLGNPLMEAMISGLPIITIDVGDTKDLIKHNENGLLIQSDKLEQIPFYMKKLLNEKDLRTRLSQASFQTAKKNFITWDERIGNEILLAEKLIFQQEFN